MIAKNLLQTTIVFSFLIFLPGRANAQAKYKHSFDALCSFVSGKFPVTIVAEDAPLPVNISDIQYRQITSEENDSAAVRLVGKLYDYRVIAKENKVYVFKKNYSSSSDMPDVTLEECRVAFKDISDLLKYIMVQRVSGQPINSSDNYAFLQLFQSLDSSQLALLKDGKLKISTLSGKQKDWSSLIIRQFFVGLNTGHSSNAYRRFDIALKDEARVTRDSPTQPSSLTITTDDSHNPFTRVALPLTLSKASFASEAKQTYLDDFTEVKSINYQTIRNAISSYMVTEKNRLTVASYLSEKHVSLFGGERAKPVDLTYAIAEAYGLQVTNNQGNLFIARRKAVFNRDLSVLISSVRSLLPDPLRRAYNLEGIDNITVKITNDSSPWRQGLVNLDSLSSSERETRQKCISAPHQYYSNAIWQIGLLLQESDKAKKSEALFIRTASPTVKRRIANAIAWSAIYDLSNLLYQTPGYIAAPDTVHFGGVLLPVDGRPGFSIGLITRDPGGSDSMTWAASFTPLPLSPQPNAVSP